jgi:hypothetical protein
MSRLVVLPVRLRLLTLAAVLAAGCSKDGEEGHSCMATKDCVAGLVCDNPSGTGGVCRKPGDVPFRPDAAVDASQRDASTADVSADRPADAATPDAAPAERPSTDAPDGGTGDGASDGAGDGLAPDAGDAALDAAGG